MNPSGVASPGRGYHHAVIVPAGADIAFVSGQVGDYVDGRTMSADAVAQARQALANLATVVRELGASPSDIAKLTTLVVGAEGLAGFHVAQAEVFAQWNLGDEVPANTLVRVAGLGEPQILVEIEAVVALPAGRTSR